MRILLYITGIIIFFSSCQLHEAHIITTKPQPFVQLKDGTTIHANKVEWNYKSFQKELIVKGKVYDEHDIAFYCDGKNSFANVHGKNFAEMISEGKINVYKTQHLKKLTGKKTGYGAGPYLRHNSILDHYYIQNMQRTNKRTVVKLNYKNLEAIIPGDAVAYDYLIKYRHQRKFSTVTACVGVGVMIGGAVLMNTKFGKNSYPGPGLAALGTGAAITGISVAFKIPYKVRLFKIIDFYN